MERQRIYKINVAIITIFNNNSKTIIAKERKSEIIRSVSVPISIACAFFYSFGITFPIISCGGISITPRFFFTMPTADEAI